MSPFFVIALPRSRTTWLSHFLAAPGVNVGHDMLMGARNTEMYFAPFLSGEVHGSCETAGALAWKLFRGRFPDCRIVVIRREPKDVVESLRKQNWVGMEKEVATRDLLLDAIEQAPGVRSFRFEQLVQEEVCKEIFEFCLNKPFDQARWYQLDQTNIQIDLVHRGKFLLEHSIELSQFRNLALAEAAKLGGHSCLGLN